MLEKRREKIIIIFINLFFNIKLLFKSLKLQTDHNCVITVDHISVRKAQNEDHDIKPIMMFKEYSN